MLTSDLRFEIARTHSGDTKELDGPAVKRLFGEMEAEGMARLRASYDWPARTARSVDMRYGEQVFELAVPLEGVDWAVPDPLPEIVERFHRRHEELYTYSLRDQETVLVNARVAVVGMLSALPQEPPLPEAPPHLPRCKRSIYLDQWIATPVFDFDRLSPEQMIDGPAVIESALTTVLLRAGDQAKVTPLGWLDITTAA
jgi:N-methylhydantoinase A